MISAGSSAGKFSGSAINFLHLEQGLHLPLEEGFMLRIVQYFNNDRIESFNDYLSLYQQKGKVVLTYIQLDKIVNYIDNTNITNKKNKQNAISCERRSIILKLTKPIMIIKFVHE